ncbi:hypothetical protein N0V82_008427 [Gnomoniopsis sp. IMI 355080]|nr:hypothetical protein N0V82_008427 [Gnomoniopsis sp. IMI 355080]
MAFRFLAALGLASLAAAAPKSEGLHKRWLETRGETLFNVFKRDGDSTSLAYVENSGICETTEGVTTYSGYLDADLNSASTMHMWYWFFSARNDASSAPLVLWLNGGPGCSSMIGLFQEHGPCHFVDGSSEPSLNEYSWNTYANMLYVDQPIESRDFALFTESYGGHYGPEFASYFQSQNAAIAAGTVTGETINLIALGINNGWIDPLLQYQAYPIFAYNNTYNQLVTERQYEKYMDAYTDTCVPAYSSCTGLTGNNAACLSAGSTCASAVETPIEQANDFNVYDVAEPSSSQNTDPPETYANYLANATVVAAIGAQSTYSECPTGPYAKIVATGDEARSFLEPLAEVVQSGINVLIWAGDLDWICNWYGSQLVVNNLNYTDSAEFQSTALAEYTVDGTSFGQFKSVGNLNFLRVYEAGHEVPYYQPEVALQAFTQILKGEQLTST